jgi:hypothetical protein
MEEIKMFYSLEWNKKYPDVWYNDKVKIFEPVFCPVDLKHRRARRIKEQNLSIRVMKDYFGDFITTFYADWLINDRVAEIFKTNNLTGYELRPVDVCNRELDFNLWELVVTGSAGKAHPDSEIVVERSCEHCGKIKYSPVKKGIGLIVDETQWDGSDFFTVIEKKGYLLVNEKVKKIIIDNNMTGVYCKPVNELGWVEWKPGHWLPLSGS